VAVSAQSLPELLPPESSYETQALDYPGDVMPPELPGLTPVEHSRIEKALDYFRGPGRSWVELCLKRSLPYRDFIYSQIETRGLPSELFWLVAVESAFSPTATSRAGAVGLWQFMKNSISGYGMTVSTFADERRDFWKATEGALDKLQDNYRTFGDWYLALAAYNAGDGKIRSAIKRSGGIHDYWQLLDKGFLPRETASYLPQLIALARLLSHRTVNGFPLDWNEPQVWDRILLDKSVDLKLLAEAAEVPWDALRDANRELNYTITPTLSAGYWLKVDPAWVEPLTAALADPDLPLMRFYLYSVQKGDTLSEIAQWYGVSIPMIQRYNPGLQPSRLKVAQNLVIPGIKDVAPFRKGDAQAQG
jgi:membrane-bound lytic murein transglycosylase D